MIIWVNRFFLRKGYTGMAIWPFVFLRSKELNEDSVLLNHEKIHLRQQLELLVIPFFLWYGTEYLFRILQYKNYSEAYRNISFEREAYAHEKEIGYLKERSYWRFFKFL